MPGLDHSILSKKIVLRRCEALCNCRKVALWLSIIAQAGARRADRPGRSKQEYMRVSYGRAQTSPPDQEDERETEALCFCARENRVRTTPSAHAPLRSPSLIGSNGAASKTKSARCSHAPQIALGQT